MTRSITRMGDRLLGSLLKTVDAGACVKNVGDRCGTYSVTTCTEHLKTTRYYYLEVSCGGPCTVRGGVPTGKVVTSHC
jgi:hypothetical protein